MQGGVSQSGRLLIPANAGELNQVWTNVIDNAIDAMDEGGELILKTRLNDIWVEIEIVDDGSGIPEEILSHVFEPFFTTKDVGVGTGVGLGIAMRIVETHQGHIEVRSKPGRTGSRSVSRMGRVEPPDHETTGPRDQRIPGDRGGFYPTLLAISKIRSTSSSLL